jgi:hypothetical protein
MARKTKKMQTDIQLPVLRIQKNSDCVFPASAVENPELDTILASVLRVFAARGRAIREERAKLQNPTGTPISDI